MKIGLNVWPLRIDGGGSKQQFVDTFSKILTTDKKNEFIFFANKLNLPILHQIQGLAPNSLKNSRAQIILLDTEKQIYKYRSSIDIFYYPLNNFVPRLLDRPLVSYLTDIQDQYFPQYFTKETVKARNIVYREMTLSSEKLITISNFSKKTLLDKFKADPKKIEVIHLGLSDEFIEKSALKKWPSYLLTLPTKFLFYPALFYKHKNHELILKALLILRNKGYDYKVVFTGQDVKNGYDLESEARRLGVFDQILYLGYVPTSCLKYLYKNAQAMLFPSLFEGFGIPLLEAMQMSCPIIANDIPAVREIAGKAAMYIKNSPKDLAEAILRFDDSKKLQRELINEGKKQVKEFSYEKAAKQTMEILNKAYKSFYDFETSKQNYKPKISIIISYEKNTACLLSETLLSIFRTGYLNYEIVVLGQKKYLTNELVDLIYGCGGILIENRHLYDHKIRTGVLESSGELIMFLLAGQLLTENSLQLLANENIKKPNKDIYLGELYLVEDDYTLINTYFHSDNNKKNNTIILPGMALFRRNYVISYIYQPYRIYKEKTITALYQLDFNRSYIKLKRQLVQVPKEVIKHYTIETGQFAFYIDLMLSLHNHIYPQTRKTRKLYCIDNIFKKSRCYFLRILIKLYRYIPKKIKNILLQLSLYSYRRVEED